MGKQSHTCAGISGSTCFKTNESQLKLTVVYHEHAIGLQFILMYTFIFTCNTEYRLGKDDDKEEGEVRKKQRWDLEKFGFSWMKNL